MKKSVVVVRLREHVGDFAADKDVARRLRGTVVLPALALRGDSEVVLDFSGVEVATQSFVHALISKPLREFGLDALDRLVFEGCTDAVAAVVETVVEYTLAPGA